MKSPPVAPTLAASDSLDDVTWIKATLNGNPEMFGKLVRKYQSRFVAMGTRILQNRADAEDAFEDAIIAAYRHLPRFQHRSQFSTWLYSILMNRIRNRLRSYRTDHSVSLDGLGATATQKLAAPEPSVEKVIEDKWRFEAMSRAVKSLPNLYQWIFTTHYFNGLLLREIAEQLDLSLGTVKAYLHHSRQLLTDELTANLSPN